MMSCLECSSQHFNRKVTFLLMYIKASVEKNQRATNIVRTAVNNANKKQTSSFLAIQIRYIALKMRTNNIYSQFL